MIKLFRKIRYNLMEQNKTSKYIKYAIGEIILVVIGILIALQLNNLNDERKIENIRQVYYKQLLQDLEKDKNYIEKTSKNFDSNMIKLKTYTDIFKQPNLPTTEILENISNLDWFCRDVQFPSNTITSLQNTGEIKLIPTHIRDKLTDLKITQDHTEFVSNANNNLSLEMTNYATRYFGSGSLLQRIVNQPQFSEYIFEENRQIELLLALESAQHLKELSENGSLESFEKILFDINEVTELINRELK
ncbi:hypothetical protein [Formosa maritima]|uniref:Uncharacterized protein n=1 Tax=Formosa maritima TaxID=2592046 RepID=A0A5D0G2Y6_9FLAO|nr:hypothetical protein [Formosa maritima]TYA53195.1 hypothetical protein FVF61_11125 [Formosa maritima]